MSLHLVLYLPPASRKATGKLYLDHVHLHFVHLELLPAALFFYEASDKRGCVVRITSTSFNNRGSQRD